MQIDTLHSHPAIPSARWADRQLKTRAAEKRPNAIAALDGATLMGERGSNYSYTISGRVLAGLGGSRRLPTRDHSWFSQTLARISHTKPR